MILEKCQHKVKLLWGHRIARWDHLLVLPQIHVKYILFPGTISARLALGHSSVLGPRETAQCACIFPDQHCSFPIYA